MARRERDRLANYYRYHVIVQLRHAGMPLSSIAEYFLISRQRVWQILKRGPVPAQIGLPINQEQTS